MPAILVNSVCPSSASRALRSTGQDLARKHYGYGRGLDSTSACAWHALALYVSPQTPVVSPGSSAPATSPLSAVDARLPACVHARAQGKSTNTGNILPVCVPGCDMLLQGYKVSERCKQAHAYSAWNASACGAGYRCRIPVSDVI